MKRTISTLIGLATVATMLLPVAAMAASLQPTVPPGVGGTALTGSGIVQIINDIVGYVVEVSVIIAIAFFIYGAIRFAMGAADEGKETMKNAAIGLVAMLAVGLLVSTIAGLIQRGLNVG